jgi:hypothetical protein
MEVSGHLYAMAALPPRKEPPEPVGMLWSRQKFLNSAKNPTLAIQPIARRYTVWSNGRVNVILDVRETDNALINFKC